MPVAKLRTIGAPRVMKLEEGNDTLDTFIRQTEPLLSFSRTGETPVQWIQLLQALDHQDLPGWPLLTPLKVQMQKCEKCNREFCSPINYRRHIRVHRRSLNVDKESHKIRDLLGAFWDKLSLDEAKESVSFKDVTLEEVPGSSIIRALTSFIRKPGFCALPPVYVRAGSAILDIIQGRLSRLPISSQELFSILDDASERTFLCAGTAESMRKYVFDGEAGKIGLEMKNLVACTSFLVEQKLVKAWLADKDAEALRCQKLLVEEEEAAQKRQAELLERKRQKKLRQKEKAKDQSNGDKADLNITADIILESSPPSTETSSPSAPSEANSHALETSTDQVSSLLEPITLSANENADIEAQNRLSSEYRDLGTDLNIEPQKEQGNSHRHLIITRWQMPKAQKGGRNGFHHINQNLHTLKLESSQNHGSHRDPRTASVNGNKVWTKKPRTENSGECVRTRVVRKEATNQTDQSNCEVMIGSISVTVRNDNYSAEHAKTEKLTKHDSAHGSNRSGAKFWRPVSRNEPRSQFAVQIGSRESSEEDVTLGKGDDRMVANESCVQSCGVDGYDSDDRNNSHSLLEENLQKGFPFSIRSAKALLSQRWKEAISGDHVKLVLTPEPGSPGYTDDGDSQNDAHQVSGPPSSDFHGRSIFGNAENRLVVVEALESSTTGNCKHKVRTKPEKGGGKIKYIPKQRTII